MFLRIRTTFLPGVNLRCFLTDSGIVTRHLEVILDSLNFIINLIHNEYSIARARNQIPNALQLSNFLIGCFGVYGVYHFSPSLSKSFIKISTIAFAFFITSSASGFVVSNPSYLISFLILLYLSTLFMFP